MNNEELAKQLVACKHWRWMPGMRSLHPLMGPARVVSVCSERVSVAKVATMGDIMAVGFRTQEDECLPDLDDPATRGCVLALVCEFWEALAYALLVLSEEEE